MACVFGEMRTLKTSERWGGAQNLSRLGRILDGQVSRNSSSTGEMRRQCWRPLLVSARLINCVAFNPSHFTSLVHLFSHPVVMTHAPLFVTAHHIVSLPHYLALLARTLSRPMSFSHWVTFALAPAAPGYMVSYSVSVSHRFALFRMHLIVCRATEQPSVQRAVPTLSHARFDAPPNARVTSTAAAPTVAAHTLLCQPLLHYCCTIQHTAHHTDHCCTTTAPLWYSTPLVTPTSVAPTAAASTIAALAMLSPNKHIRLLHVTFLLFPQIIHSLAFLFFSPIVIIAHAISPLK